MTENRSLESAVRFLAAFSQHKYLNLTWSRVPTGPASQLNQNAFKGGISSARRRFVNWDGLGRTLMTSSTLQILRSQALTLLYFQFFTASSCHSLYVDLGGRQESSALYSENATLQCHWEGIGKGDVRCGFFPEEGFSRHLQGKEQSHC